MSQSHRVRVPKYRLHKASGRAAVTIDGRAVYLGKHGTIESREKYDRVVAEYLASRGQPVPAHASPFRAGKRPITVVEAGAKYLAWCEEYRPHQLPHVKGMLRVFVDAFQYELAANIGPLALKEVRKRMIESGHLLVSEKTKKSKRTLTPWTRRYVNAQVNVLRRMYGWLVENELLSAEVANALKYVKGLRASDEGTVDRDPIGPVDDEVVDATLPHLPEIVADMVRLQRLTGMRPAEVCMLRPCDLDRSTATNGVWRFRPKKHKTQHRGKKRIVFIGPQAQAVLLRHLARDAELYCFSPADSEAKRRPKGDRVTKNVSFATKYDTCTYRRAIHRACDKAFVHPEEDEIAAAELDQWRSRHRWSPNQLRHTAATEIRKKFGIEAAQVVLGHASADVTQIYAERDLEKGAEVARRLG